jgi:hypothetical protein
MKLSSVLFATCALLPLSVYPAFAAGSDQAQDKRAAQYRAVQHAMDMVNMPTIGPLFLQDSTFSTKLTIVNAGLAPVTGFVTLRSLDGTTIIQQPVPVKGNSSVILEIGEMLSKAGSLSTRGRLELYDRTTEGSALAGQLTISYTDKGRVHAIDEELMMPSMTTSHALRGIAIDTTDEPYYAITNPLTESETVTAKCYPEKGAAEQGTFNLQAQETVLVQGCHRLDDSSNLSSLAPNTKEPSTLGAFAIELIADAPKGEVQAFGIAPRPSPGGSEWTAINFFDPQKFEAATTIYTGVPLGRTPLLWGTYTPHVALHNFADKAQNVTVQLDATAGDTATRTVVGSVTMQPGESRSLDIADAVGSSELLNTLIVTGSEISGGIASQLMVEDRSQDLRMQIIGKSGADDTNIGMHPWTIVDGTSNELLLYNQTTKAQKAYVKIANGEKSWLKTMTLGPGTTIRISLAHLIQGHAKDDKGVILTAGQGYGEFSWSADDQGRIKGRLLHLNEDKHTIESFQCAGYQTLCDGSVTGTTNLIVGQQGSWSANFPACINNLAPNLCGGVVSGSANIASYSWFAGNIQLPADTNSALISGYATAAGNDTVTANATALGGCVVSASANVSISQFSVTFSPSSLSVGVGTTGSLTATVNPSNNTNPITLSLVPSGSGAAVFAANGSSTITITGTRTLSITGSSLTSSGSPIALKATVPGETSPIEIDQGRASITVGYPPAVVTNISPSVWTAGTTFSVTISGSNFGTSPPTVSIASGAGVTISQPTASSPTQLTATVSVAANAPNETVTISVQPNYGGSNFTCNCQSGQSPDGTATAQVQPVTPTPRIMFNGNNISGTTQSVMAGQQIALSVTAPSGYTIQSRSWSFSNQSAITGGFVNGAGTPGTQPSASAGGSEAADPPLTTQDSLTFYWVNPGDNGETVTYTYTLNNGQPPVSATATFNIGGPTGNLLPSAFAQSDNTGTLLSSPQAVGTALAMTNAPIHPVLNGSVGVFFNDNAQPTADAGQCPPHPGAPPAAGCGQFIWVQILNSVTQLQIMPAGDTFTPLAASNQLDGTFPYASGPGYPNATWDSPNRGLSSSWGEAAEPFNATMYVLWDPALPAGCIPAWTDTSQTPYKDHASQCTSTPIPLGSVQWKWSACAINAGAGTKPNWFLQCGIGSGNSAGAASGYPQWKSGTGPGGCSVSDIGQCQPSL